MGTIAQELTRIQTAKADIKTAIEAKGVTVPSATTIDGYASLIGQISGGGGLQEKDVNYYDYDGTLLYAYTKQEYAALTAHPENPTHEDLTSQGWNWSLADAKDFVNSYGKLNIGQSYVTTDGKTHVHIKIDQSEFMSPTLYYYQSASNGVTVDWGDNSQTDTLSGTGNKSITHTYASQGDYVIKIAVTSGYIRFGNASLTTPIVCGVVEGRMSYLHMVKKIFIGSGTSDLYNYCFNNLRNLKTITIPTNVSLIGSYCFQYCVNLQAIVLSNTITTIGSGACSYCISLSLLSIPKSVTTFNNGMNNCINLRSLVVPNQANTISTFYNCTSLTDIVIPNTITQLQNRQFIECESLRTIKIPSSVLSLGSSAFSGCKSLHEINIPNGVTTISSLCFQNCYSMASCVLPTVLTTLENSAFASTGLISITIPSSVTSIENGVFAGCLYLSNVYMTSTTPPTLGIGCFNNTAADLKIYVPSGSLSTYQSATNWSAYASKMVEYTP